MMQRFETIPREITAEQWFLGKTVKGVHSDHLGWYVITAHGQAVYIDSGDWIVPEPDGRGHYPIKQDIFATRYRSVKQSVFGLVTENRGTLTATGSFCFASPDKSPRLFNIRIDGLEKIEVDHRTGTITLKYTGTWDDTL